ncbi:MAG: class I SAM-dependent methyltransferase [Leptolyngbyaceae cyanobacterium SL_1_1]|nr:class I SAM-dependent methyltransferase [Leptolyngbyaceae cyanobacterium SL_1_1]
MRSIKSKGEKIQIEERSFAQIKKHYLIEKALASQLKASTKAERIDKKLYTKLYDELFRQVPDHTQLSRLPSSKTDYLINQRVSFLEHFFRSETTFLEIGCGSGHLTSKVAAKVNKVYAVDVSEEITQTLVLPDNVELIISDGISIPVPEASIDVAYSHQLMEHLHPDDAVEQLQAIYRSLRPGGVYVCVTPNRLCGPHDVSKYFDQVATAFHLKEYSVSELYVLFEQAKFVEISLCKIYKQSQIFHLPIVPGLVSLFKLSELILENIPFQLRRRLANSPIFFRSITMVGTK